MRFQVTNHITHETREVRVPNEVVTIGCDDDCAIVVAGPRIAEVHVTIKPDNGRLFVEAAGETKIAKSETPLQEQVELAYGQDIHIPCYSIRAIESKSDADLCDVAEDSSTDLAQRASGSRGRLIECCVLSVDMAHFARIQDAYVALLSGMGIDDAAARLYAEILKIFQNGVSNGTGGKVDLESVMLEEIKGDEAVLRFDSVGDAHAAAVGILKEAEAHNQQYRGRPLTQQEIMMRCFRVGLAWGTLEKCSDGSYAGPLLAAAKRLQEGGKHEAKRIEINHTGEVRICAETYQRLEQEHTQLYGGQQGIPGKASDNSTGLWQGHRYRVAPVAPWEDAEQQQNTPIVVNPDFPKIGPDAPKCFVVSPLDGNDPRILEVYERLIVPACADAGFDAQPAEKIGKHSRRTPGSDRLEAIKEQLRNAPMVVAYLGSPSPSYNINVIFEIGFRLAMQKPIVLISESPKIADGQMPSIDALLPFHLKTRNVLVLPESEPAGSMLDVLTQEIETASSRQTIEWKLPHAVAEVMIYGDGESEDKLTYVSPAAGALFHIKQNDSLMSMITRMQEQMPIAQQGPFFQEQQQLIDAIEDATRKGVFMHTQQTRDIPRATVPMVLPSLDSSGDLQGYSAHLPIIVKYSRQKGATRLRVLYLDVMSRTEKREDGVFVCDLSKDQQWISSQDAMGE